MPIPTQLPAPVEGPHPLFDRGDFRVGWQLHATKTHWIGVTRDLRGIAGAELAVALQLSAEPPRQALESLLSKLLMSIPVEAGLEEGVLLEVQRSPEVFGGAILISCAPDTLIAVPITDDELQMMAALGFQPLLDPIREAGDLLWDLARSNAFEGDGTAFVRANAPAEPYAFPVDLVQWSHGPDGYEVAIGEHPSLDALARWPHPAGLRLQGRDQHLVLRPGPSAATVIGDTLQLSIPAAKLAQIQLPRVVEELGATVRVYAFGVTPAPMPTSAEQVFPSTPTRLHHYHFTYKMLPAMLQDLELDRPNSSQQLFDLWQLTAQCVTEPERLWHHPDGRVPGTQTEGRVGLGVVSIETLGDWKLTLIQMPLATGPGEAIYMAIADRGTSRRLLSWERRVDGMACVGEWWVDGDEYRNDVAGFGGPEHISIFRQALGRWLDEHPNHPLHPAGT